MSMTKEELIRCIESIAPKELMEDWDNTGIQLDVGHREINRVLVCLDICSETIEEAIQEDCEFIVSHHPMIFAPVRCDRPQQAAARTARGGVFLRRGGRTALAAPGRSGKEGACGARERMVW